MALNRQSIEKKDFPTGRQGYDRAAVDAHLAAIADEFEHLTLASSASERVRAIVEAAETSAAQIQRDADDAALATRQEAEQAARHAREGAAKLSELAAALGRQLDESRRQLEALAGLPPPAAPGSQSRTEARVYPDPADPEPEAPVRAASAPATASSAAPEVSVSPREISAPPSESPAPAPESPAPPPAAVQTAAPDETDNARLIALNMALNGSSRDETARYLGENFRLADRDRLLDEVYASLEG